MGWGVRIRTFGHALDLQGQGGDTVLGVVGISWIRARAKLGGRLSFEGGRMEGGLVDHRESLYHGEHPG